MQSIARTTTRIVCTRLLLQMIGLCAAALFGIGSASTVENLTVGECCLEEVSTVPAILERPEVDDDLVADRECGLGPAEPREHVGRTVLEGVEVITGPGRSIANVNPDEHVRIH